jgi:hypothetical protein
MFLCAAKEDSSRQQTAGRKLAAASPHPAQVSDESGRAAITGKIVLMVLPASSGLQF